MASQNATQALERPWRLCPWAPTPLMMLVRYHGLLLLTLLLMQPHTRHQCLTQCHCRLLWLTQPHTTHFYLHHCWCQHSLLHQHRQRPQSLFTVAVMDWFRAVIPHPLSPPIRMSSVDALSAELPLELTGAPGPRMLSSELALPLQRL